MKIAVISDVHGNKSALDKVLDDIKQKKADKIYCLGDIAMGGYDPNYTINKLFELKKEMNDDFEIIQGNTDKLIVDYNDTLYEKMLKANPLMAQALNLDVKIIDDDKKRLLSNLNIDKILTVNGVKIHLVHGSPRKQDENIFPDTPSSEVEKMVETSPADVILCGHTHIPCGFSLNSGKTVVNAGSIGRSMTKDKMPVYLLMTIDSNGAYSFEHIKVKYDNKQTAQLIKERNFELSEEFSKLYL